MKPRRSFLATSLAALGASALPLGAEPKSWNFCTFTKPFQHLSYGEMAKVIAELGFAGIEAPVRPKGHVVPERVEEDLPKLVEALKAENLEVTILASGINAVSDEQRTEVVLRTAAQLGIKRFRMAYYKYNLEKPILAQLDEFRPQLRDLIALSRELGIKPIYQNHSGKNYVGASLWDLHELLREHDPADVGSAYDIGHSTVEGGKAWELDFRLMRPYIDSVYIKEPAWNNNTLSWGHLGDGVLDPRFFKLLKQTNFDGPVNLHVEYLGHKDPEIIPQVIEATRKDFATLKTLLQSA
tara:strand:- start:6676 stop:7566 length:891 start_codon:yes stop_codon:yes gene_type:complete